MCVGRGACVLKHVMSVICLSEEYCVAFGLGLLLLLVVAVV